MSTDFIYWSNIILLFISFSFFGYFCILWNKITSYKKSINNEYWLYYISDFKKWARISIEYMIISFSYMLLTTNVLTGDASKFLDIYKIIFSITIPFLTYILVRSPIIIDPAAKEIDDFLMILRKTVLLLDIGKKFLEASAHADHDKRKYNQLAPILLNNSLMSYIQNGLNIISLLFTESKLHYKPELEFILDIIQININSFNNCLADIQSSYDCKDGTIKFLSYYNKLLLIHRYFLYKNCTKEYKKYFFYTFKDIKKSVLFINILI